MLFNRTKYTWLILAMILLTLSFILMSGPKPGPEDQFNEEIFSFRRITLAPLITIVSYIGLIFIILKQPKKNVRKDT
ncbi:DUF3098 domain-containing protein [Sunxiuqinia sp. A32]|uniref:DUF3098 domain-containing protein n=1 Tax=Sunxiuqinia sp. A32 TaxID=3461496 RepID=UPI004045ADEB